MTTVYVVVNEIGGFAHEDPSQANVIAALTDKDKAETLRMLANARIVELELDVIPPGYVATAKAFGRSF